VGFNILEQLGIIEPQWAGEYQRLLSDAAKLKSGVLDEAGRKQIRNLSRYAYNRFGTGGTENVGMSERLSEASSDIAAAQSANQAQYELAALQGKREAEDIQAARLGKTITGGLALAGAAAGFMVPGLGGVEGTTPESPMMQGGAGTFNPESGLPEASRIPGQNMSVTTPAQERARTFSIAERMRGAQNFGAVTGGIGKAFTGQGTDELLSSFELYKPDELAQYRRLIDSYLAEILKHP
jgi:hypothetical protein